MSAEFLFEQTQMSVPCDVGIEVLMIIKHGKPMGVYVCLQVCVICIIFYNIFCFENNKSRVSISLNGI